MSLSYLNERELFCELGRRSWQRGYVAANDGNFSMRLGEGRFLCTPAGVSKGFMTPEMLLVVDAAGQPLEASEYRPSSELPMHLRCYELRPDVGAVCHAHPPAATAFAVARKPLDAPLLAEVLMTLGTVPVAPYGRTGTMEIPEAISPLLSEHNALLLSNHGALTLGRDLLQAYHRMETLEHTAQIHLNVLALGGGVPLTPDRVEELLALR